MAQNREQFTTEIFVNQDQANEALGKLQSQVDKTAKAYEKLLNQKDADPVKTDKARKAWESAKASLEGAERGVEEYAAALKNLTGQSMDRLMRMQKQINAELKKAKPNTQEWNKLAKEYAQVTTRIQDLRKEQNSLMNQQKGLKGFFDKVGAAGNKFGLAIMAIPNAIKPVIAALRGVINVTKQVVNASQTMGDKWNNGMAAMKTTTEAFFMALSSGDWTAFNNGISEALKKARELAELKDLLGSFQIAGGYITARYRTDYTANLADATNTDNDEATRRAALENAQASLRAQREFTEREAEATFQALQKMFEAWKGITFSSQDEFDSFFDRLFRYTTTGADQAVQEIISLQAEVEANVKRVGNIARSGNVPKQMLDELEASQNAYNAAVNSASQETLKLVAAADLNDEKLKELIQTYSQWRGDLQRIEQDEKGFNRTRDRVNKQLEKTDTNTKKTTKTVDAYAEAIKRVDKAETAQLNTLKSLYASGVMNKTEYEAQKAAVEEDYLKQRIATSKQYGKDTDQYMQRLLDRQISRMEKAKAALKQEYDDIAEYYMQQEAAMSARYAGENGGDARLQEEFQEKIWSRVAEIRASIADTSARDEYLSRVAWAEKLAEKEMLTEKEAQEYILKAKLDYASKAAAMINGINEQASNFVTSLKEAESAKLEAEYQKQLTAAGDNAERREQVEAEYEEKKLALSKKYADTEMVINIAKTVAAGALAAIQAFAQLGPVGGAVAAALIAATTAAEVATIIQQRNAIKNSSINSGGGTSATVTTGTRSVTGYYDGGYTGTASSDHKVVGVAHANEWYAPAWMVRQNPIVFANLERVRRAGAHSRSNPARGFESGGFTGGGLDDIESAVAAGVAKAMASGAIRTYLVRNDLTELDAQTARLKSQTSR